MTTAIVSSLIIKRCASRLNKYLLALNERISNDHDLDYTIHGYNTRSGTTGKYEVSRVTNYYGDRT